MLREQQQLIESLKTNLHRLLKWRFGPKTEALNVDQFGLFADGSLVIEVPPGKPGAEAKKSVSTTTPAERRHYLRAVSQSEALRQAVDHTYAAHVHNAVHATLSLDLVRAVGSLILDNNPRSASAAQAVAALRVNSTLQELRREYAVIPPITNADQSVSDAVYELEANERQQYLDVHLPAQLTWIEKEVLSTDLAERIRTVRNKMVAHSDVVHDATNWEMWEIKEVGLTYGQLHEYIDRCTEAVDKLSGLVLRTAFAFDDLPRISQKYADAYIEALVIGLNRQKELETERRAENFRRTRELLEEGGDTPEPS